MKKTSSLPLNSASARYRELPLVEKTELVIPSSVAIKAEPESRMMIPVHTYQQLIYQNAVLKQIMLKVGFPPQSNIFQWMNNSIFPFPNNYDSQIKIEYCSGEYGAAQNTV